MPLANLTQRNIKTMYKVRYNRAAEVQPWKGVFRTVTTDQPQGEEFGGLLVGTGVHKRGTPPVYRTSVPRKFSAPVEHWEIGRTLSKEEWEFNKVAKADERLTEISNWTAQHPGDQMEDLLMLVTSEDDPVYPESTAFCATDHPRDGSLGNQSNAYSGNATYTQHALLNIADADAPTDTEWGNILFTLAMALHMMTNYAGQGIGRAWRSFTPIVGATLWVSLNRFLARMTINSGDTNEIQKAGFSFSAPWLVPDMDSSLSASHIMLAANGANVGFIQRLKGRNFGSIDVLGPGSEYWTEHSRALMKDEASYSVKLERYQGLVLGLLT